MSSIQAASSDKSRLEEMVSNYFANQSMKQKYTDILTEGTQSFYDLAADKSMWHNTEAVRTALTDSMNVYSSVTEYKLDSSEYASAKAAADAAAKKISDAYAEQLAYREDKLGFKINGVDTEYGENETKSLGDYIATTSNGMFVLDFSKIENLGSYYKLN
jgi:tRNA(Glu) U13 pseudouridine synthase TruD